MSKDTVDVIKNRDPIVGIDLGTTNSEISAFVDGKVCVLGPQDGKMLASCVGISPEGELLVGVAARNQQVLYPERTIRSVKRKMGEEEKIQLGDREFTPQEVSSLILRELVQRATAALGQPVKKAVITVPAYFSDAQRQATREAGALAGLEVARIINEPTAAGLAYGGESDKRRKVLVYDLGGGTFDVSIVSIEGDVTEVLSSHGNNRLGGDDFDDLLLNHLLEAFREKHGVELTEKHQASRARLWWAAEEAKKRLSSEPFAKVREENLLTVKGKPLHLDLELERSKYEEMIRPLVESTLDKVSDALKDANMRSKDLDSIILVGGSTRTPMISRVLEERTGILARQDVDPDLCVAYGAGLLASRLSGHNIERILVDVSPYSFGVSHLGDRGGVPYPHCYHPTIYRNTPLPITRTDVYQTASAYQETVEVDVYQGDDPDALRNIHIGNFKIDNLTPTRNPNLVLCRMHLDIDGILHITAIEKITGKAKHVTITDALKEMDEEELAAARKRMESLFASRAESDLPQMDAAKEETNIIDITPSKKDPEPSDGTETQPDNSEWTKLLREADTMLTRTRDLLPDMPDEDKEDAIDLIEQIEIATAGNAIDTLREALAELKELLFFVEG